MAASKIIPKKSVISKVPEPTALVPGEIAINYADKIIYGRHPSKSDTDPDAVVALGAPYEHSHDQLISLDPNTGGLGIYDLELTNTGEIRASDGSKTTTIVLPAGTISQTITLPNKTGTVALLDDITGGGGGSTVITNDLDRMFTSARATYYHELSYTSGGDVESIEVYTDSTKATHLYTRTFTYDSNGNISTVVTTDLQNAGLSLTKTITYNGAGNITSVNRNYTL